MAADEGLTANHALSVELIGRSDSFLEFGESLARAAKVDRPVLLVGERGTGKELAAARLHYLSKRWRGAFAMLNCAALAPSLMESELFGHEAGAFTGAGARRKGRFEVADGGTLFLDEIGNMPLTLQEKILSVVEYGVFQRVGGARSVSVDARIIGATNVDLPTMAGQGKFKRDLLDRLSFEVLTLPPLRARREDIPLLASHFASRMAIELGVSDPIEFSDQAFDALMGHPWPGNIRELKNAVERAVFRAGSGYLQELPLDPFESPYRPVSETPAPAKEAAPAPQAPVLSDAPLPEQIKNLELGALRRALSAARHNQRRAAAALGLSYNQFRGLYRKHKDAL